MTDVMDLANAAVEAVGQGTADAIGNTVVDLVRRRLSGIGQGEEAVLAVQESPDDPDARSRLHERLSEVLSEDPAFAADLASVLVLPEPNVVSTISHSINVDRGSRARGTFVLGNQAVTKIRKGDPWALMAVVAAVAVMALLIWGLARLATDGDGPPSAASGHRVTALKDSTMVKAVAPDLHSMPSGWTSGDSTSLTTGPAACQELPADHCPGLLSVAQGAFDDPYDQYADFIVAAWGSADDAQGFYERTTQQLTKAKGATQVAMPAFGDQSIAIEFADDNSNKRGQSWVQVGTVVVAVSEGKTAEYFGRYQLDKLQALTRMVAERAQQAQDGHTPSATARDMIS
ncbi:hypothetical protein ABZ424_23995 [Streptomyces sp. NPDC005790]|uniref:hypothetical protein n=1 Tax=Streptomyces sp. NPDC005790 TaxID=3154777 RepID=UPI0033FDE272